MFPSPASTLPDHSSPIPVVAPRTPWRNSTHSEEGVKEGGCHGCSSPRNTELQAGGRPSHVRGLEESQPPCLEPQRQPTAHELMGPHPCLGCLRTPSLQPGLSLRQLRRPSFLGHSLAEPLQGASVSLLSLPQALGASAVPTSHLPEALSHNPA